MLEIRFHGRGGQGALTAARILASAFWKEGKYSLVLPEFRSERRSAPIVISLRVDEKSVVLRSKIYAPDYLVVLDPSLLDLKQVKVLDGFKKGGGGLVVVSASAESKYLKLLPGCRIGIADANSISRKYGLGNAALPATGTAMLGAFAKVTGLVSLDSVIDALQESDELPKKEKNVQAVKDAFNEAQVIEAEITGHQEEKRNPPAALVLPASVVSLGSAKNNLTGAWRTIRPFYENKMSPCQNACPLSNDTPQWISLIKQGRDREAWEKLVEKNPLPAVIGRVCPAFCQDDCNRKEFDESLSIKELEKYLGDKALASGWRPKILSRELLPSVAVVGSGPAGLSFAYQLIRRGFRVTVFEALPAAGGMLRAAIPDFRLPKDVLQKEIASNILSLGVELRAGIKIGESDLAELHRQFSAVFVAVGLQKSVRLNIPGEESPGVLYGLDFLKAVNLGKKAELGKKVIVIGGGNTAIDVARTAGKLGSSVAIFYRRTKAEMPAIKEEVTLAESEGIKIKERAVPVKILRGPTLEFRNEYGVFQESADKVIIAIGGEKDFSCDENILSGGDFKNKKGTVAAAIGSGRMAAYGILSLEETASDKIVKLSDLNLAYFKRRKRKLIPHLEAERCFSCGVCDSCGNCWKFCPHMSVLEKDGKLAIDYDYCKGCGICAQECPKAVISQELEGVK